MNAAPAPSVTLHSGSVNPQQAINDTTGANSLKPQRELELHTTNTMPPFPSPVFIERLYEEQDRLIEKRNVILDNAFVSLNPAQQKQLDSIDSRLDYIESNIAMLRKQKSKIDVKSIVKTIADDTRWINEMAKKIRSKE